MDESTQKEFLEVQSLQNEVMSGELRSVINIHKMERIQKGAMPITHLMNEG